ncbi:MAG: hypothetical protein Kapaf2KO_14830 [Candidatus Kapaibacteriales bacterium]
MFVLNNKYSATERQFNVVIIIFVLSVLINWISSFEFVSNIIEYETNYFDFKLFLYYLILILQPIGVFLFWLKNYFGWFILNLYSLTSIFLSGLNLYYVIDGYIFFGEYYGGEYLTYDIIVSILTIIVYGSAIYVLNKRDILKLIGINKKGHVLGVILILAIAGYTIYSLL